MTIESIKPRLEVRGHGMTTLNTTFNPRSGVVGKAGTFDNPKTNIDLHRRCSLLLLLQTLNRKPKGISPQESLTVYLYKTSVLILHFLLNYPAMISILACCLDWSSELLAVCARGSRQALTLLQTGEAFRCRTWRFMLAICDIMACKGHTRKVDVGLDGNNDRDRLVSDR